MEKSLPFRERLQSWVKRWLPYGFSFLLHSLGWLSVSKSILHALIPKTPVMRRKHDQCGPLKVFHYFQFEFEDWLSRYLHDSVYKRLSENCGYHVIIG